MAAAVVNAYGKPPSADEAVLGNEAHEFFRQGIENWKAGSEWGDAIASACNAAAATGMDSYTVYCIRISVEFIRDLAAKHGAEREHVLTEHWLDMSSYGIERGGTADVLIVIPYRLLIVVDLKSGFIDQGDAANHDQIMIYGVAGAATFKVPTVEVYLFQPRNDKPRRASGAKFDAEGLRKNAAWTSAVVKRAMAENPELHAGYEQCKFCPALTHCPAAQDWIMNAIEAFDAIGAPTDPDSWGELVAAAKIAEKRADGVTALAKARLSNGDPITGWGLAAGREIRSIDAAKAIEIAKERGTLDMLLQFVSVKAEASKVIEGLEEACSSKVSAPSLRPVRRSA